MYGTIRRRARYNKYVMPVFNAPTAMKRAASFLIDLIDYRLGALVQLVENPPRILSDDSKHGHDDSEQQRYKCDNRREASYLHLSPQGIHENPTTIPETCKRNDNTRRGHQPNWKNREPQNGVEEKRHLLGERPPGFAELSVLAFVINHGRLETKPVAKNQRINVFTAFLHVRQCGPIQQCQIVTAGWILGDYEEANQLVVEPREEFRGCWILPLLPRTDDIFAAPEPMPYHLDN